MKTQPLVIPEPIMILFSTMYYDMYQNSVGMVFRNRGRGVGGGCREVRIIMLSCATSFIKRFGGVIPSLSQYTDDQLVDDFLRCHELRYPLLLLAVLLLGLSDV